MTVRAMFDIFLWWRLVVALRKRLLFRDTAKLPSPVDFRFQILDFGFQILDHPFEVLYFESVFQSVFQTTA